MATSEIQTKPDARAAFTLEIASNLAAGVGRIAAMLTNTNKRPAAEIGVRIKTGAVAPVAGGVYDVYLVRYDGLIADDGATGLVEAAYTQVNAEPLGSIVVTNGDGRHQLQQDFQHEGPRRAGALLDDRCRQPHDPSPQHRRPR